MPPRRVHDGEVRLLWFGVAAAVAALVLLLICASVAVWMMTALFTS
jgi:hypothetical protein